MVMELFKGPSPSPAKGGAGYPTLKKKFIKILDNIETSMLLILIKDDLVSPMNSMKQIRVKKTADFFTLFLFCLTSGLGSVKIYPYKEGHE